MFAVGAVAACQPAYIDVATPKDAQFELICAARCGQQGVQPGTLINVSFGGGARGFSVCCDKQPAVVQHLMQIRDVFCPGGEVPSRMFGDLEVFTVVSEATGKRGAAFDHGEGYAAFNCGGWLEQLIDRMQTSTCCGSSQQPKAVPPSPPAAVAPVPVAPPPTTVAPPPTTVAPAVDGPPATSNPAPTSTAASSSNPPPAPAPAPAPAPVPTP